MEYPYQEKFLLDNSDSRIVNHILMEFVLIVELIFVGFYPLFHIDLKIRDLIFHQDDKQNQQVNKNMDINLKEYIDPNNNLLETLNIKKCVSDV